MPRIVSCCVSLRSTSLKPGIPRGPPRGPSRPRKPDWACTAVARSTPTQTTTMLVMILFPVVFCFIMTPFTPRDQRLSPDIPSLIGWDNRAWPATAVTPKGGTASPSDDREAARWMSKNRGVGNGRRHEGWYAPCIGARPCRSAYDWRTFVRISRSIAVLLCGLATLTLWITTAEAQTGRGVPGTSGRRVVSRPGRVANRPPRVVYFRGYGYRPYHLGYYGFYDPFFLRTVSLSVRWRQL